MSIKTKKVIAFIVAAVAGGAFLLGLLFIVLAVASDIKIGALSGEPETGYAIVAAMVAAPVVILLGFVSFLAARKYFIKSKMHVALIIALSVVIAGLGVVAYKSGETTTVVQSKADEAAVTAMLDVNSKAQSAYTKTKVLPATIETTNGITYEVTETQNVYKVCGQFEVDTLSQHAGSPLYSKITAQQVFSSIDSLGAYSSHQSGTQCYKIMVD